MPYFSNGRNNQQMNHPNHHRTLTVKNNSKRLSKSSNFDQLPETPTHHPRINTCSNINRSILRMQSSPINCLLSHSDSIKQNIRPLSRMKNQQSPLLQNLFSNILKHRHTHSRALTTDKQKQRFLQRFSQTISKDSFKVTGFQLDHQSLGFVFDYIGKIKQIKNIVLDGNPLGLEGAKKLAKLITSADIRELSLVSVGMTNKEANILFEALEQKACVRKLNFSSVQGILKNKITLEGVEHLNKLLSSPHCALEVLRMDYVLLGNQGLKTAFTGINARYLQQISLSKNDLSSKYISLFMSSISNLSVNKLDLSKNSLSNDGLKTITDILGSNYGRSTLSVHLNDLSLSNNKINSIAFENFCREMYSNQTLQKLYLDDNPLGEGDRFFNIKYYIHKNWRLKELSLANISCSDKDLRFVCEGVETNRSLQFLNISRNEIDSDTLFSLFTTLTRNRFLRKLQIDSCKISDISLLKIDSLLTSNTLTRIEEISMENNYLGNKAAQLLKQMLVSNPNILKLFLSKNCIGERPLLEIRAVLKENQRKRPFQREMHYFNSVIDLYAEKKRNLKEEVNNLKEKEQKLKICALMDVINKQDHLKTMINSKIKLEKRSIAKLQKKLKPKGYDFLKEPSETGSKRSSLYITEFSPVCTMLEIHPGQSQKQV